ncbi:MAG: sulfotransferase domain-containing protein [Kiritimatiellae bacterium]|nr:sulfotransferase domain-containing protein [Kiritimatiellia bacterium]
MKNGKKALRAVSRSLPHALKTLIVTIANKSPLGRDLLSRHQHALVDAHILSYPKSGRTWLRLILGKIFESHYNLQLERPADLLETDKFPKLNHRVPLVMFSHENNPHLHRVSELDFNREMYISAAVIFLSRDPRDVVVSSFFQHAVREDVLHDGPVWRKDLSAFLHDDICGIENIIAFMNCWAMNRNVPRRFMLIRYEDMINNAAKEIWRVLTFLAIKHVEKETVRDAVELGSFDNMKKLETENALDNARLRATDLNNPESFKVRKGKIGGYVDYLSSADIEYVDNLVMKKLDGFFGYGT